MIVFRIIRLLTFLCCLLSCDTAARPPLTIEVLSKNNGKPYRMNGDLYTVEELRKALPGITKGQFDEFAEPPTAESWFGMVVHPESNAPFSAVMQLLELLKDCKVTAYSIVSARKSNPKTRTELTLPVYSSNLRVQHHQIEPVPPELTPEQRLQQITEKMGGRPSR